MKFLQGGAPGLQGQRFGPVQPQVGVTYRLSPDAPNNPGALAVVESVGEKNFPFVTLRFLQDDLVALWSLMDFSWSFRVA